MSGLRFKTKTLCIPENRPYKCTLCEKDYKYSKGLKDHKYLAHSGEVSHISLSVTLIDFPF
jgi:uncharacterized Zn-finger protein